MRGHGFQPLLPSVCSLSGGRGFAVEYHSPPLLAAPCYGRCYACSLTVTHYWIPSSSSAPQTAAGERTSSRRSGHWKVSGRLRLQENDIKLWIWRHLLRKVPEATCEPRAMWEEWRVNRSMQHWALQTRWSTLCNPLCKTHFQQGCDFHLNRLKTHGDWLWK